MFLVLCVCGLMAQAPEKFTYQAVVRNAGNSLVTNAQVGVRVSVLQGSAQGTPVFVETHSASTNANGLVTLEIGGGNAQTGSFSAINWADGVFFLKTEIDPNGGSNYSVTTTQQLLSVPYALYAKQAGNGFSGDYNDLVNTPTIPTVPTNVSAFTNDAGYITMDSVPAIPTVPTNVSAFTNDAGYLTGYTETDPLFNAWDKNYNDLTNKPEIPTVPTNVSAFTNDAGYLTGYTETDPQFNAWDKNYNDLTNKPEIPTVPTNVSAFTNDAGYITMDSVPAIPTNVSAFTNDAGYLTSANVQEAANIPTNVSAFTNDAGYITMDSIPAIPEIPTDVSAFNNDMGYLTEYTETDPLFSAWSKDYNDLTNTPTIPTVPTNVSAFTNDAGYITMDSIPAIPDVPTDVSAFTNDAGYLTSYTETDPQFNAWNKSYNDLIDKPVIPAAANDATLTIQRNGVAVGTFSADATDNQTVNIAVPTQTSQLENNSGYITMAELQQILAEMNHRIDSLENVINGTTPEVPEDTVDGGPCPGHHTVTDVEGNTYNTVWIGGQCWMKENLRTRKYPDGTDITFVNSGLSVAEGRCYYPNGDAANVTSYGYLYNWAAAMHGSGSSSSNPSNVQGACPDGWHLPSYVEWTQLLNYVKSKSEFQCGGNNNNIAKALSSVTGWQTGTAACAVGNDASLNNQTGFSAMPAGTYNANYYIGSSTEFWSSTEKDGAIAYTVYLSSNSASPISFIPEKKYAYSVRCLLGTAGSVVVAPSVTTLTTSEVTKTSVKCGGVVTQDGGSPVTARGVCWSTGYNPALIEGQYTVDGTGTGSFVSQITGLNAGATYRAWAYATNSEGTTFGEAISFTTTFGTDGQPCSGAATVTDVDGNVYNTIMLGDVCWMKENLRTTKFPDGTPIALGTDSSSTMAYRYYPNNDSSNVATYGYLYNWSAFIHNQEGQSGYVQGICPAGWHIPKNEMSQLDGYVSGQSDYVCGGDESNNAKALASTEGWKTSSNLCAPGNNPASNNVTGFSLPPAGYYRVNYSSETFGQSAVVWHANSNGTIYLWPFRINYSSSDFSGAGGLNEKLMKSLGHSVRCVRN